MTAVIETENLYKRYNISAVRTIWNELFRLAGRSLRQGVTKQHGQTVDFWALNDVSLEVKKGETLGIIGPNGAGKSTLLKLLCGVTEPTSGRIKVQGRVAPLIEIGAGFHPELTGKENIILNAAIMGMKKNNIRNRMHEIVEFSGLEPFLNTPVKRYSSGMLVRLGFSVAVHMEPEILLVDEVLSVGDVAFQRLSLNKIRDRIKNGGTVVFVSHNLWAVQNICNRVIALDQGKIVDEGIPTDVISAYEGRALRERKQLGTDELQKKYSMSAIRRGSGEVDVENLSLSNADGNSCSSFRMGADLHITFELKSQIYLDLPTVQLRLFREDGIPCTLSLLTEKIERLDPGKTKHVHLVMRPIQLTPSRYSLVVTIHDNKPMLAYAHSAPVHFEIKDIKRFFKTNDPVQPVFEPIIYIESLVNQ